MIYRVYDDKRHEVVEEGDEASQGIYCYVKADADGWIPWSGGELPLPEGHLVDVRYRTTDVEDEMALEAGRYDQGRPTGNVAVDWEHHGFGMDIIAYRPVLPEWDGEGLPAVGAWVEIRDSSEHLKISHPAGTQVKIYAHFTDDRGVELAAFVDRYGKVGGVATAKCFRPIRSEEDKAVDEMVEAIFSYYEDPKGAERYKGLARALYRAGYRKQ